MFGNPDGAAGDVFTEKVDGGGQTLEMLRVQVT